MLVDAGRVECTSPLLLVEAGLLPYRELVGMHYCQAFAGQPCFPSIYTSHTS